MNIYLIRHTAPDIASGICYGQTDLDVADSFFRDAEILQNKLKHILAPKIYSSPLKRCTLLAEVMAQKLNTTDIKHDQRLMELDFGDWEMRKWEEIPRGSLDVWAEEHVTHAPPNGESFIALHSRAKSFLSEVILSNAYEDKVIFTHSGVIRALVAEVLDLPLVNAFKIQIDFGSVSKIIFNDKLTRIACLNS